MDIKDIAILYGDTRHGRSCGNCFYYELNLAKGGHCKYNDLPTQAGKVCGTWCGEIEKTEEEVNQGELF